jgi:hypothetical protein
LVKAWGPEQVVEVGKLGVDACFLLDMVVFYAVKGWQQAGVFVIAGEPGEKRMEFCDTPFRNLNYAHLI